MESKFKSPVSLESLKRLLTATELPEGIAAKPDDFESKPYEHDPLTNTWVPIDKWL